MISLGAHNLGLTYSTGRRLSLAPPDMRLKNAGGHIGKRGGRSYIEALRDVSFSLGEGDRLGLVGRNGSGKTSLLKVLYGIYKPTTGRVERNGRIDALFNIRLGFRVEATGRRNIVLRGLINGWSMPEIENRMDDIIEFSEIGEFIDMPLKTYSQGMAARLAFSAATCFTPEILLMDEWIGAGDNPFQEKARERMKELSEGAGIIVLASHNHGLIKSTCNKILELEKGQVKNFSAVEDWDG